MSADAPDLKFFTLHQVAETLQLPYELVRDKVYGGSWPHVKFSERNRRMTQEQIERVIAISAHEPQTRTRSEAHQRRENVRGMLRAI